MYCRVITTVSLRDAAVAVETPSSCLRAAARSFSNSWTSFSPVWVHQMELPAARPVKPAPQQMSANIREQNLVTSGSYPSGILLPEPKLLNSPGFNLLSPNLTTAPLLVSKPPGQNLRVPFMG